MATFTSVCVCLDRSVSSAGVAGRRRAKIAETLLWEGSPVKARLSLIVVSFRVRRDPGSIAVNAISIPSVKARSSKLWRFPLSTRRIGLAKAVRCRSEPMRLVMKNVFVMRLRFRRGAGEFGLAKLAARRTHSHVSDCTRPCGTRSRTRRGYPETELPPLVSGEAKLRPCRRQFSQEVATPAITP